MNILKKLFAISGVLVILSGCSQKESESGNKEIIPEISIGMTKEEVYEIYGEDYAYCEDHRELGYKDTVEYGYSIDRVDTFNIDIETQMFFEFENDEKLVCYGYHIGRTGDYYDSIYPYSESELTEAYNAIYSNLTEWYGDSESGSEYSDQGILHENSWENEHGLIWFIVGVNMWSYDNTPPEIYEKGVNEIVLSCSAPE